MKHAIWAAGVALLTAAAGAAVAEPDRVVSVDGRATLMVEPDIATVRMAVTAQSVTVGQARDQVVQQTRRFLEFAESQQIDDEDIQTFGLSVQPTYRFIREEGRQEVVGYTVMRDIVVELDDLAKLGDVIEGAVTAGINQVQPAQLGRSDARELRRRALAEATIDARANAMEIAESLGARVGAVRTVSVPGTATPRPSAYGAGEVARLSAASDAGETYNTGLITITAVVSAQFDLVPD